MTASPEIWRFVYNCIAVIVCVVAVVSILTFEGYL